MDNGDWRKYQRNHWPKGSLETALIRDYPGAKSLLDALKKTIESKNYTASQTLAKPPINDQVQIDEAVKTILAELRAFDPDGSKYLRIDPETRARLGKIPTNSLDDAKFWQQALLKEMKRVEVKIE